MCSWTLSENRRFYYIKIDSQIVFYIKKKTNIFESNKRCFTALCLDNMHITHVTYTHASFSLHFQFFFSKNNNYYESSQSFEWGIFLITKKYWHCNIFFCIQEKKGRINTKGALEKWRKNININKSKLRCEIYCFGFW